MRIVIVGGPRCGKSTLARQLRADGIPTYCGDPESQVKEPEHGVIYLREGLGFGSAASQHVVNHWLDMPGSWCLEGHVMARALRKYVDQRGRPPELDRVIVLLEPFEHAVTKPGQRKLCDAVRGQWADVKWAFPGAEYGLPR